MNASTRPGIARTIVVDVLIGDSHAWVLREEKRDELSRATFWHRNAHHAVILSVLHVLANNVNEMRFDVFVRAPAAVWFVPHAFEEILVVVDPVLFRPIVDYKLCIYIHSGLRGGQ